MIQENTPGKDGQEYTLRCTISDSNIPQYTEIKPFEVPFLFYNGKSYSTVYSRFTSVVLHKR